MKSHDLALSSSTFGEQHDVALSISSDVANSDSVVPHTNSDLYLAICDIAEIFIGKSKYDFTVPFQAVPHKKVIGNIEKYVEYISNKGYDYAISCEHSKLSFIANESKEHLETFLRKYYDENLCIQKGKSGKYYCAFQTSTEHGVYNIRIERPEIGNNYIVEKDSPGNVVAVNDAELINNIGKAPHASDQLSLCLKTAKLCDISRSADYELNCEILFSLIRSGTKPILIGSILRGIGNAFAKHLWSQIAVKFNVDTPDWESIEPVRLEKDVMMYLTWLKDEESYKRIYKYFKFKRNSFDPEDQARYMDKINFSYSTVQLYDVLKWIGKTVAYIVHGGNGFWVTKNFDSHGSMHIERVKDLTRDLKHTISAIADNIFSDIPAIAPFKLSELVNKYKDCVSFESIDFTPYSGKEEKPPVVSQEHFNTFVGYPIKYERHLTADLDILHPLFYHVRNVLADGDVASFEYIVYWMAHIIQKPRDRTGVCLTFTSVQGAGKGIWWEWFGNRIIGKNQYLFLDSIENLFNRFNSEQECKLFTVLDEAQLYSVQRKNNDRFKSALTESTLRIEPKGSPIYTVTNYNNFVMLTNQDLPVRVDVSDRRHACFQVSNYHKGNVEYFEQLAKCQHDVNVVKHFYHFLENLPLSGFRPQAHIPDTQLKRDLKIASMPSPIIFLTELVKGSVSLSQFIARDTVSFVSTDDMHTHYKLWAGNNFESKIQFSRIISSNLHMEQHLKRIENKMCRGYNVSLQLLSQRLQATFGDDILY